MKKYPCLLSLILMTQSVLAQNPMIVNLFELGVKDRPEYNRIAKHNIQSSIAGEAGTLAMYSLTKDKHLGYMLELYRDEDSYQMHLKSKAYQDFLQAAPKILTHHKKKTVLVPLWLYDGKISQKPVAVWQKITFHKPNEKLQNQLLTALTAQKADTLASYVFYEKDSPEVWHLFWLFDDEKTAENHGRQPELFDLFHKLKNKAAIETIAVQVSEAGNQGSLNISFPKTKD